MLRQEACRNTFTLGMHGKASCWRIACMSNVGLWVLVWIGASEFISNIGLLQKTRICMFIRHAL